MNIYGENIEFKPKKNVKVDEKYVLKFKKSDIFGTFHAFQMSIFRKVPNIFQKLRIQ